MWSKIKKNYEIILAWIICGISMYIFCTYSVTRYPTRSTLLTGDVMGQYLPAVRSFVRSIWNGQSLEYSWSLFLGMNSTAYYGTYVGGSFVNFIYLLVPWMSPEAYFQMALVLKTALIGASFTYFSKKVLKVEGVAPILMSIFYSLCGFQFGINVVNYIWMDAMYLLPLIIVFITEFLTRGKWIRLVLAYAYLFLCNFYMGYIVGFFSALYFILYLFFYNKRERKTCSAVLRIIINYGCRVVLAIAMAAFVILPLALFIITKNPADTTQAGQQLVEKDIILLLSRLYFGIEASNFVMLPYLYVGIPTIILVAVFFVCKAIEKKEKLFWGLLTVIMILPCMFLTLYMFWHGFDNPDSWYHRFSYVIAFLLATMACRAAKELRNIKKTVLLIISGGILLASAGILIYGEKRNPYQSHKLLAWNIGLIIFWIVVMFVVLFMHGWKKKLAQSVVVLLAMCEVIANGCLVDRYFQSQAEWDVWYEENTAATQLLLQDSSFYRVRNSNSVSLNPDTWMGYMGVEDFWSYENYECKNTLGELGMLSSPRYLADEGLNPVTQLILGVKYGIRNTGERDIELAGANVYQYPCSLGLGYLVDKNIVNLSFDGEDSLVKRQYEPDIRDFQDDYFMDKNLSIKENTDSNGKVNNVFINGNRLITAMIGNDEKEIFVVLPSDEIELEEQGITFGRRGDDYFLLGDFSVEGTKVINFRVKSLDKDVYVVFEGNNEIATSNMPYLWNYYNPMDEGVVGVRYCKEVESVGDEKICTIVMAKGRTRNYTSFKEVQFYYVNWDVYQEVYDILSQHQLALVAFKNGYVQGNIEVLDTNQILFTSIPYDDGWKVTAKDANVEKVSLLDGAFLGVIFPTPGTYELTFVYTAPGAMAGKVISIMAWLVFIAMCFTERKSKKSVCDNIEEKQEVDK